MTRAEQTTEYAYRVQERLAILADGHEVEGHYYDIAKAEADAWLVEQRGQFYWQKE